MNRTFTELPDISVACLFITELGTRLFCRDNASMLPGHKVVCNCQFTIFIVLPHLDTEA